MGIKYPLSVGEATASIVKILIDITLNGDDPVYSINAPGFIVNLEYLENIHRGTNEAIFSMNLKSFKKALARNKITREEREAKNREAMNRACGDST